MFGILELNSIIIKYLIIFVNISINLRTFDNKSSNCPVHYENKINQFILFNINNFNAYFNIISINYTFSYKYIKLRLNYYFCFYDKDNNLIIPSDLSLYYNLHVFCVYKKRNVLLQSISYIHRDIYFSCLEYCDLKPFTKFGIQLCNDTFECRTIYLFTNKYFDYNNLKYLNNDRFELKYNEEKYFSILNEIHEPINNSLVKSYISYPICYPKEKEAIAENIWYFKNIYSHYFCFCKGKNCTSHISYDDCKYYFYLSLINDNKNLYKKTYYLLHDFLYGNRAPGDSYFVFKQMVKQNMSAYYLTERKDIYLENYDNNTKFQRIIPITNRQYNITGNILEKYFSFFLKLKAVVSGSEFFSKENIFLLIPYITFICLGHGVNYFKPFLYEEYYGCKRYNKILLSSEIIISIAKRFGWKEENIIKIGLPKWDLFDLYSLDIKNKIEEKCIFMMFTWRKLREGKNISSLYFNNILEIANNPFLNQILNKQNISFYISLHHNLLNKQNILKSQSKAKYINQENILNYLMKCNLIISDFSSVIFDLMYRKKPFIIFIPDANDKDLKETYDDEYFDIINGLKNDSIKFENKYFEVNDTINKIQFYINNNFQLEENMKFFYRKFKFFHKDNINRFIKYLQNIE